MAGEGEGDEGSGGRGGVSYLPENRRLPSPSRINLEEP
jgi:hypothetical protein